jgi:hypothetical protein
MSAFVLHPEAYEDLDEIWEYIADDNLNAADRLLEEFSVPFDPSPTSRIKATNVPISPHAHCFFTPGGITSSPTYPTKNHWP